MTPARLGLLWLAAATVRLTAVALFLDHPALARLRADAVAYHLWGARIAAGDLAGAGAWPAAPLFAHLLGGLYAVVGADPTLGRVLACLVGAAAAPLAALVAARRLGAAAGWVAGGAVVLYGPLVVSDAALQKEGLAAALLVGAVVGAPTPTTGRLGENLWLSHRGGAAIGFRAPDFWDGRAHDFDRAFAEEAARLGIRSWTGEALREIGRAPGRAAARAVLRLWCFVRDFPREDFAGLLPARRLVPIDLLAPVRPGLLVPLGLAGLFALGGRTAGGAAHAGRAPLLALLGVFALRAAVLFPLERYRLPVAPVWAVCAAAAVVTPWTARRAAVLAAALAAAFWPAARLLDEDLHARDALGRLAVVSAHAGRSDDAALLTGRPPTPAGRPAAPWGSSGPSGAGP